MDELSKKFLKSVLFAFVISIIYFILSWYIESILHDPLHHDKLYYYLKERVIFVLIGLLPALFTMKYYSAIYFMGSLIGQFVNVMICKSQQYQRTPSMAGAAYEIMITFVAIIIGIIVQIVVVRNKKYNT